MKLKLAALAVALAMSAPALADNASAYIGQSGMGNYGNIDQNMAQNGYAQINQYGNNNNVGSQYTYDGVTYEYAGIQQYSTDGARATANQYGDGNSAYIGQSYGSNLNAVIQQGGYHDVGNDTWEYTASNNNYASAYQSGTNNDSQIMQFGNSNGAYTGQYGYGGAAMNTAKITQTGNFFYASISQSGSGNRGVINQR